MVLLTPTISSHSLVLTFPVDEFSWATDRASESATLLKNMPAYCPDINALTLGCPMWGDGANMPSELVSSYR